MARKLSPLAVGCGVAALLLLGGAIFLLLVGGLAIQNGIVANPDARPAGKIPARHLRQLQEMGVTRKDETVLFFYSAAFTVRGDGNLFTDQRVISYQEADGVLEISDATYDEIAEIEFLPSGTWLEDSTITVTQHDGSWFVLYISTGSQGDALFYNKLMEEWRKHKRAEAVVESDGDEE